MYVCCSSSWSASGLIEKQTPQWKKVARCRAAFLLSWAGLFFDPWPLLSHAAAVVVLWDGRRSIERHKDPKGDRKRPRKKADPKKAAFVMAQSIYSRPAIMPQGPAGGRAETPTARGRVPETAATKAGVYAPREARQRERANANEARGTAAPARGRRATPKGEPSHGRGRRQCVGKVCAREGGA